MAQIAREFLCSKSAVRDALIANSIPIRKSATIGHTSRVRFGERKVKGKTVPHQAERRVLESIVEMRDREGLKFRQIADFLLKIGVPTGRKRKSWTADMVRFHYVREKSRA